MTLVGSANSVESVVIILNFRFLLHLKSFIVNPFGMCYDWDHLRVRSSLNKGLVLNIKSILAHHEQEKEGNKARVQCCGSKRTRLQKP